MQFFYFSTTTTRPQNYPLHFFMLFAPSPQWWVILFVDNQFRLDLPGRHLRGVCVELCRRGLQTLLLFKKKTFHFATLSRDHISFVSHIELSSFSNCEVNPYSPNWKASCPKRAPFRTLNSEIVYPVYRRPWRPYFVQCHIPVQTKYKQETIPARDY